MLLKVNKLDAIDIISKHFNVTKLQAKKSLEKFYNKLNEDSIGNEYIFEPSFDLGKNNLNDSNKIYMKNMINEMRDIMEDVVDKIDELSMMMNELQTRFDLLKGDN